MTHAAATTTSRSVRPLPAHSETRAASPTKAEAATTQLPSPELSNIAYGDAYIMTGSSVGGRDTLIITDQSWVRKSLCSGPIPSMAMPTP